MVQGALALSALRSDQASARADAVYVGTGGSTSCGASRAHGLTMLWQQLLALLSAGFRSQMLAENRLKHDSCVGDGRCAQTCLVTEHLLPQLVAL